MCFVRGDSTYINLYFPGAFVAKNGTTLTCSNDITLYVTGLTSTITITPTTIVQRQWGIQCVSTYSGYGSYGVGMIAGSGVTFSV